MRIGIDSYALGPLGLTPLEMLQWAARHDAGGVQFSGLTTDEAAKADAAYLKDLARFAEDHHLYLEWGGARHIPMDMLDWRPRDIFASNRAAAAQAALLGTRVIRSCSGGLMRWDSRSPSTETFLEAAAEALRSQRRMLLDHGVILAIETHFEFTTFELLRLFDMCDAEPGQWLGICLDSMNLLTMLEDPLSAVRRILPWVVATHIKDGGIRFSDEGLITFPAEIGKGIVDIAGIVRLLSTLPHTVHLSIEDHGGRFSLPVFDEDFLAKFPDLSRVEFAALCRLSRTTESRMRDGLLEETSREDWPRICEERVTRDIEALRRIASDPP